MLMPDHKNKQFVHSLQTLTTPPSSMTKHMTFNVFTLFRISCMFFALLVATMPPAFTPRVLAQSASPVGTSCQDKQSLVLPIKEEWTQGYYPWCWATTTALVIDHHRKIGEPEPCNVVNAFINNGANCCLSEQRDSFESGCATTGVVRRSLEHFGFHASHITRKSTPRLAEALVFKRVSEELCSKGPFISRLKSSSGLFHTIVVHGYTITPSDGLQLHIRDPQNNFSSTVPYEEFIKPPDNTHIGAFLTICDKEKANCHPE